MNFLPEDYEVPKRSNFYMKLKKDENRFRVLSTPIIGWEDWKDKKPVRYRNDEKPERSIDPNKPMKHFWAFLVYNYVDREIQILQITQASIMRAIQSLRNDKEDWGEPFYYDIKIVRSGEGMETKYQVNPVSKKPLDQSIIDLFFENPCNLEALYTSEDPFSPHWESYSKLAIFENGSKTITKEQGEQLTGLLGTCDPDYVKTLWDSLKKQNIVSVSQIPSNLFDRIKIASIKNQKKGENDLDVLFPVNSMDELVGV